MATKKLQRRNRIRRSIRGKVSGTADMPRLAVFRSNKQIYAQVIDDVNGKTITAAGSLADKQDGSKVEQAKKVGEMIAERAKAQGVEAVVFDRGGYLYHGRVKALADAAREAGLKI
jgi:large subunit ribosomal protein L18